LPPVFEDTVRSILLALSIALLFAISAHAQTRPSPPPPIKNGEPTQPNGDGNDAQQRLAREMAKKANQQRQAALKADADKLLRLAVELKDSVDKSNENLLSLEVLKKAEEIEKLAHSVKDKMKGPN
jgi:type VI protein secretion system component VasF